MASIVQLSLLPKTEIGEDPKYLEQQIITYIGNKRSLLPFIGKAIEEVKRKIGKDKLNTLDLFSGSGIVARYLKQHSKLLIVNDIEPYSEVANSCYLANFAEVPTKYLDEIVEFLRPKIEQDMSPGFITELYAPRDENNITISDRVFYTRKNAMYLDTARKLLDKVPGDLQRYLLAPLLSEASVHANTSGVFKGFYKNKHGIGQYGGHNKDALVRILGEITIKLPVLSRFESQIMVYRSDANELLDLLPEVDIAYFDPPYNQHPYGSNYFMLNLLVDYKMPKEISSVSGIPTYWQRSRYNKKALAEIALFDAISRCKAKYVLISYNSEGFIPYQHFICAMNKIGKVEVMETPYNTFRGSRNLRERSIHVTEYLYLLEKR